MRKKQKVDASEVVKPGQHVRVRNGEVVQIADDYGDLLPNMVDGDKIMQYTSDSKWETLTLAYKIDDNGSHYDFYHQQTGG